MAGRPQRHNGTTWVDISPSAEEYDKQIPRYGATAGTANAKTVTVVPAFASYFAGLSITINNNLVNTGATTINVNGKGVKSIVQNGNVALKAGDLPVGIHTLVYDGVNFILQGKGGGESQQRDMSTNNLAGYAFMETGGFDRRQMENGYLAQLTHGGEFITLRIIDKLANQVLLKNLVPASTATFESASFFDGEYIHFGNKASLPRELILFDYEGNMNSFYNTIPTGIDFYIAKLMEGRFLVKLTGLNYASVVDSNGTQLGHATPYIHNYGNMIRKFDKKGWALGSVNITGDRIFTILREEYNDFKQFTVGKTGLVNGLIGFQTFDS